MRNGPFFPVNRTAANVLKGGIHFTPKVVNPVEHWKAPPQTIRFTGHKPDDMSGLTFGRMKVIGYLGEAKKGGKGRWLCRCICGDYEPRYAKSIRSEKNTADKCRECKALDRIRLSSTRQKDQ